MSKSKIEYEIEKETEKWMKKPMQALVKFNMRLAMEPEKASVFDLAVANRVAKLLGIDINEMAKEQTMKIKGGES